VLLLGCASALTAARVTLVLSGRCSRRGFISVLSPLGWSLLGQRVGQVSRWSRPRAANGAAEVLAILFSARGERRLLSM
jgi:transcription elongation GreA/GreB family factor